jgi:hypothetical protein
VVEREKQRVSDGERQAAVERLRVAHDEGRLNLDEYDTRLAAAYSSVTYGDLDRLFDDLPAAGLAHVAPGRPPVGATSQAVRPKPDPALDAGTVDGMHLALRILWTIWGAAVAINLTVWFLVSLSAGDAAYFWPMWMAVPGVVLFGATVGVERMRRQKRRPH